MPMIAGVSGVVTNALFDWLLIFGIGVFPELGIKGAAIATIIGQFIGMLYGFILMKKYIPPFTITNKMLELTGSIMEKVGKLDNFSNLNNQLQKKEDKKGGFEKGIAAENIEIEKTDKVFKKDSVPHNFEAYYGVG